MSFRTFSTALWYLSTLVVLLGTAALFAQSSTVPLVGELLSRPHLVDKVPPILILTVFAWVLVELGIKKRQVQREHKALGIFRTVMEEADQGLYKPKAFNLKEPRAVRRADLIVECSGRDPSSLHEAVPAAAALDSSTLAAGYTALNVYAWILPVLGFIGTASGMASSIDGFKDALRHGGDQVQALAAQLGQSVIPGLAGAFETTILALAAALVAYLCTSALRSWDQEALDQLDRLCIVLLSRIPQPEGPEGKKILATLTEISDQLRSTLEIPKTIEGAATAISAAAETLASAGSQSEAAAKAMKSAAEVLEVVGNKLAPKPESKDSPDGIAGAISMLAGTMKEMQQAVLDSNKELHKDIMAPITIEMKRSR